MVQFRESVYMRIKLGKSVDKNYVPSEMFT